ncbi:hypothetical protein KKF38_04290 [Patescibacteria group bacterium]|nr:hypothetical protein [Patescibacteria group bacterium]
MSESEVFIQQEKSPPERRFFRSGFLCVFSMNDIKVTITEENLKNRDYNKIVRLLQTAEWQPELTRDGVRKYSGSTEHLIPSWLAC